MGFIQKYGKKRRTEIEKNKQNNGMKPQQKEKMRSEKGMEGGPNKTSTVTGKKRREREVKIRKNTAVY